jgi:hypothetical protein
MAKDCVRVGSVNVRGRTFHVAGKTFSTFNSTPGQ